MTTDARAAAQGGASLLVVQSLGRLLGLGFVVVATRHLLPDEFGRYSTVAALVLFGNFVADFGTSSAITRLVSRSPSDADELLSGTLLGSLVFGLFAYVAVVAFALASYSTTTVVDVAIGGLAIPSASVLSSLLGALDGTGLISRRAALTALQTSIVAAGVLPVMLGTGVRGPLVTLALAPAASLLVAARTARRSGVWRSRLRLDLGRTALLVRSALPYAATGGLSALTMRFDVLLLSLVSTAAETARYDIALRLLESCTYLSAALTGPLLFLLSRRLGAGDRDGARRAFAEALRVLYLLGLPLSVGFVVLARPIVALALGSAFRGAATPFAIMGAAQWLTWLIYAQSALAMAGDHMHRAVVLALAIAGATVVLDLVLVPTHGAAGAAVAMVAAWSFTAVLLDRFGRRTVGIPTVLPSWRIAVAVALQALALAACRRQPLAVPVVVGGAVYVAGLLATRAITGADVARMRSLLGRPVHA